ncbi:MAG: DUF1573 domain-containing protein [Acidobacteria bacterium]|nr:DUF1573 domain-containing protein [Acidobacteriota bacterium]
MRLLLTLSLPAILCAQAPTAQPAISFEKVHHDFGKISPDKKVAARYKVTNTGKAYLNITNINPSCGCTSTMLGKWSLAPGESEFLEATFDPKGNRGVVRKSIQVTSNDPANPVVALTMEAEVIQEIMPSTTSLFFSEVPRTTPRKGVVRLSSGNGQPVQVTEVKVPGAPYLSTATRQEGNDVVLELTFDGSKVPGGQVRGVDAITVRTSSQNQPLIAINAQWELKSFVTAKPERVAWAEPAGKELRATLTLSAADGKAFLVTGVKSSNPLIRVEGIGKKAQVLHELQVVLSSSSKAGSLNERLTFTTTLPEQPEVDVRVAAILR